MTHRLNFLEFGKGYELETDQQIFICTKCGKEIEGQELYFLVEDNMFFHKPCGLAFTYPIDFVLENIVFIKKLPKGG